MALVVPSGGLISQVNGTVDNKVYYRGRWGNVVRAWVNPANTITPERTAVRALFASLVSLFNSLTPSMQDEWNSWATSLRLFNRLAQPYIPTGLQMFMQRNTNLALVSAGPLLFPPIDTNILAITSLFNTFHNYTDLEVDGFLSNGTPVLDADHAGIYYMIQSTSPGTTLQTNRYRITQTLAPSTAINTNLFPGYSAAWLAVSLPAGSKLFTKLVIININTGIACKPAYCSQIIP